MLTEEQIEKIESGIYFGGGWINELCSDWRELQSQPAAAQAELDKYQEVASKENTLLDAWIVKAGEHQREAEKMRQERDEYKATYELMSAAGHRAILLWRERHPDSDIWPDQAENMVWLMEQLETARKSITVLQDAVNNAIHLSAQARSVCCDVVRMWGNTVMPNTEGAILIGRARECGWGDAALQSQAQPAVYEDDLIHRCLTHGDTMYQSRPGDWRCHACEAQP